MTEFTAFVQRPDKVDAFQFTGPHQVEQVLDAFGADKDHFNLAKEGAGKYRLTFQHPTGKGVQLVPDYYHISSISVVNFDWRGLPIPGPSTSSYTVVTGSWVVRRYVDTDHPEVTVLSDREFRQKYQASIEAK